MKSAFGPVKSVFHGGFRCQVRGVSGWAACCGEKEDAEGAEKRAEEAEGER